MTSSINQRSRESHVYNADLAISVTTSSSSSSSSHWEPLELQHALGGSYCEITAPQEAYVEFATQQEHERVLREGHPGLTVENWKRNEGTKRSSSKRSSSSSNSPLTSPTKRQRTGHVPETTDFVPYKLAVYLAKKDYEKSEFQDYFDFLHSVLEEEGFLHRGEVAILRYKQISPNSLVMEAASPILAERLAQCHGIFWGAREFKLARHTTFAKQQDATSWNDYYQQKHGHPDPSRLCLLKLRGLHSVKDAKVYLKKQIMVSSSVMDLRSVGRDKDYLVLRARSFKAAMSLWQRFRDTSEHHKGRTPTLDPLFVKDWKEWHQLQKQEDAAAASSLQIDTPHDSNTTTTTTTTVADGEKYDHDNQNKVPYDNDPPLSTLSKQPLSSSSAKETVQLIDGQQHSTSLQEAILLKEENDRLKSQLEKLVQLRAQRHQQQQPQGAATTNATANTTTKEEETSKPTGTDEWERLQDELTNLRNQLQEQESTETSLRKDLQETKDALTIKSQQLDAVHQSWQEQSVLLQEQATKLQTMESELGKEREQYRELTQSFAKMTNSFDRESSAKRKAEEACNEERRRHKETKRVLRVLSASTQRPRKSQKVEEEEEEEPSIEDDVDI